MRRSRVQTYFGCIARSVGVVGAGPTTLRRRMSKRKSKHRGSKRQQERAARSAARRKGHKGEYLNEADPDLKGLGRQLAKLGFQILDVQGDGLVKALPEACVI